MHVHVPSVEVIEGVGVNAATAGGFIGVTRAALGLGASARDSTIAHELGHVKLRHHWNWPAPLLCTGCATGSLIGVAKGWPPAAIFVFAGVSALMLGLMIVDRYTMLLEWQADAAASTALGQAAMSAGVQALLAAASNSKLQAYYANRLAKLSGAPASLWKP